MRVVGMIRAEGFPERGVPREPGDMQGWRGSYTGSLEELPGGFEN